MITALLCFVLCFVMCMALGISKSLKHLTKIIRMHSKVTFCVDVHDPQRMNLNHLGDLLKAHSRSYFLSFEISQHQLNGLAQIEV